MSNCLARFLGLIFRTFAFRKCPFFCHAFLFLLLVFFLLYSFNEYICTPYSLTEDEEEEGVHLVPGSADDAPSTTAQSQDSAGETCPVSSRPSGRVVGVIKRNWHS